MSNFLFIFKIRPQVKERPRFGKYGSVYTPKKTKTFEDELMWLAKSFWRKDPLEGLLRADIEFIFESPKKTKLDAPRKDLDNLCKSCLDSLNKVLYVDDNQVVELSASKRWGDEDLIKLSLTEIKRHGTS